MSKYIIFALLSIPLFSCVNLKNSATISGVYIGKKEERNYRLELKADSTFHYELAISSFPKASNGKWYLLTNNSILLVCDPPGKNPLFQVAELLIADRKIELKFKSKKILKWRDEKNKVHILYRKSS